MQLKQLRQESRFSIHHCHRLFSIFFFSESLWFRADHLPMYVKDQIVSFHSFENGIESLNIEDSVLGVCCYLFIIY
jgi:hypothetical protein